MKHSNLLIFSASPRRGNCEAIAEALAWRALARGAFGPLTFLRKKMVRPCAACGTCAQTEACVFDNKDQGRPLFDQIADAQGLIVVSPVYFYGPPSQLKSLVDRSQAIWEANKRQMPTEKRPAYVVLTAARMNGERLFDASLLILRCFFDVMGFRLEDSLLMRGLDGPDDFRNDPNMQEVLTNWSKKQLDW